MLPVISSCSDSLSACGSIDVASPWLANLNVTASAVPAANAAATAMAVPSKALIDRCLLMSRASKVALPAASGVNCGRSERDEAPEAGRFRLLENRRLPIVGVDVERVAQPPLDRIALSREGVRMVVQPGLGPQRLERVLQRIGAVFERHGRHLGIGALLRRGVGE